MQIELLVLLYFFLRGILGAFLTQSNLICDRGNFKIAFLNSPHVAPALHTAHFFH
jgi:hypothetical protein